MQFMTCSTCARVVQINNTGICLGCQRGFTGLDAEDIYKPSTLQVKDTDDISNSDAEDAEITRLKARQKEIEDALQEQEAESVDVRKQASNGQRVGSRNPEGRKTARKGKATKEVNLPKDFGKVV